jgi:hypothetical protein
MPVDETPSKVYIHDLAAEIAQIEAEEPKDMFLLDIDKRVSALPAKLFQNSRPDPNTQLVLSLMLLVQVPSTIRMSWTSTDRSA